VRREAPVQQPVAQPVPAPATQAAQPVPTPQPAAEQQEPIAEQPAEQVAEQPPVAEEPLELRNQQQPAAAEPSADTGSQVYGPVVANQTLWEIALESRASRELTVQQTMLAIQRLNPEAFIDNNINLLKKGAVLRLPSADEVRSLSLSEAIAEVTTQNSSWRQRLGDDSTLGAPLDARAAADDSNTSDAVEGRVSLAAPGDNEALRSGSGSGAEDSEALTGELAVTEEELDKSRLENGELQERITELEDQIDTMEELVDVSNEELRAVQTAAEQTNQAAETEPSETVSESETTETAMQEEVVSEEPAAVEEQMPEDDSRNRVVAVPPQAEPTLLERLTEFLMKNVQMIGIGAGVLILGLFGLISWRRRQEEEAAIRQVEAEMAAERSLARAPQSSEPDHSLAAVQKLEEQDSFDLDQLDDVDTGDPVAEAEIHLSLGQYREAEKKLLAGLDDAPHHVDARLMLLEVYAHEQKAGKFDEHYRELLTFSDGPAADRAARLRETIAGAGHFEAPVTDFSSESLEATQLDDISASFDDDFSSELSGQSRGGSSLLDDLTLDLSDNNSAQADDDGDFTLDLELDSDMSADLLGSSAGESRADDDDFNLDDLMSGGGLDLDSLDLDSGSSLDTAAAGDSDGLEFDLDLTPMTDEMDEAVEKREAAPRQQAASSTFAADDSDDLKSFGADLDGLDLDSIDLGDISALDLHEPVAAAPVKTPVAEKTLAEKPVQTLADAEESDLGDLSFNLESDLDSELNLLEGSDEVSTKLELAQAYLDMGDKEGAKDILGEVVEEGSGEHKQRAKEMLERMA
jgi:pilus assembly protein FimV